MALTPKLEIKQTASLLMTPQLRQAINLLQMSNLELNELVEKELETNPLLEREDEKIQDIEISSQTIDDYSADLKTPEIEDFSPDVDYDNRFDDDFGSDREGYEQNEASWQDYAQQKNNQADDDFDYFEKKLKSDKSLYTFLDEQISLNFISSQDRIIAFNLVEHLDDAGYFRGDIKEIASRLKTKPQIIENILNVMKSFEPSGIFAQSLKECLEIQLRDANRLDVMIQKLLDNLELLGQRNFKELKKICQADDDDLGTMISDIKSLNPKPTQGFKHDTNNYVIPDVFVRTNKHGEYIVELNNMSLPRVLINQQYYSQINKDTKETKRYLKEQLSSASFLVRALQQRATTILRVSEEIVKAQYEFFEKGINHLKPMFLKDIAEKVEMHESTISRVTTNKYMHTPSGMFELKYFFSAAAGSYTGDDSTSVLSIKHKIKQLIDNEDKDTILSDDKLVEIMAQEGIKIARRTITKYREALGIPTSAERKRTKRNTF